MQPEEHTIRMTEFSHGAGCGCKIAPALLEKMLQSAIPDTSFPGLLVGNATRDDAAVFDLGNGTSVISTTDFFMPIVDDPFEFGRIAATNAISDVYAMGGRPLMAISIFGWPLHKLEQLGPEVAARVIDGGRHTCHQAGIPLAGGHSIDSPEPVFGLAVTGLVDNAHLKRNDQAEPGCRLYLTKGLGIGILTTAQKKKRLKQEHAQIAPQTMCRLNTAGAEFGRLSAIRAMTDVTGFGLMGHLLEICNASHVRAQIDFSLVPRLPQVEYYLELGCSPGGTQRNFESYGHQLGSMSDTQRAILCDPQTSGGLLVAVHPDGETGFLELAASLGLTLRSFGRLLPAVEDRATPLVEIV